MHAHWVSAACFQNVATLLAERREKAILRVHGKFERSCWNASMQAVLSMFAFSGPLTLAAAYASNTSAQNFIALFPDGVAVYCVWQGFSLTGNNHEQRKPEESSHFLSVLKSSWSCSFCLPLPLSLTHIQTFTHAHTHTHTHTHTPTHTHTHTHTHTCMHAHTHARTHTITGSPTQHVLTIVVKFSCDPLKLQIDPQIIWTEGHTDPLNYRSIGNTGPSDRRADHGSPYIEVTSKKASTRC